MPSCDADSRRKTERALVGQVSQRPILCLRGCKTFQDHSPSDSLKDMTIPALVAIQMRSYTGGP
jgi:hypothetical protein